MPRGLRNILVMLILAGAAWYVWATWGTLKKTLLGFDERYTLPMLMVPLASLGVNGAIGRILAAEFGVRLGIIECFALATVNAFGNYLPVPQAGAMARGVYLKNARQLPWASYAASVVVTYVSSLAISGILGLGGLGVMALADRPAPWQLWLVFSALALSVLMFTPLVKWVPLPRPLRAFGQGLNLLRGKRLLIGIILLQVALVGLTATGLYLACQALPDGRGVTWAVAWMMGLMLMASGIINLTPGNIGVEQGAAELTARLLNVPPGIGFAASALFRAMAVIVVFLITPLLSGYLARRMARMKTEACLPIEGLKTP